MWAAALAAPIGTLVGAALHEISHAAAAELLGGRVVGAGWRGGWRGGPYISWENPDGAAWRPVAVGLAPIATAILFAAGFVASDPKGLTSWFGGAGALIGLLWLSAEDVDPECAKETFEGAD